jgi:hypothetical protein
LAGRTAMTSERGISKAIWIIILLIVLISSGRAAVGSDDHKVIQSSEILTKIEKLDPVEYTNVIVMGDLDIGNTASSLSDRVDSPIILKNCEIRGTVSLNNTSMENQVTFEKTVFSKPVYSIQTRFMGGADFDGSRFNETAMFRRSLINQTADFEEVRFNKFADFGECTFNAAAVDFRGAYFKGIANFVATKFNAENTNFQWTQFDTSAKFWHAVFGRLADFKGSHFGDIADFYVVQFNDTADFSGAKFEKELFFNDVSFKTFKIQWASIEDKLNCNGPPYLLLIKNFKDLEQFDDADSCYYQYRDWRRVNRPLEWAKIGDYIAWLSCGYGVRWHYTILSGILVMVLFGLYYESYNLKNVVPNFFRRGDSKRACKYEFKENLKKAISFSAITLLSLPSEWSPFGRDEYNNFVKHHLCCTIFERMIGWGLLLLLIGTLSRLMVRY